MSFLYYNDTDPDTRAIFKAIKADEYLVKDPDTNEYIPFTGGGGEVELPYWVQPNAASLGSSESKKTTITSEFVDVVNNLDDTASSLSASQLVFGDSTGNSSLTKASIDAANRVRDVALDATPASRKMLLYDTATKGLSYGNQPAALPVWVKTTEVDMDDGLGNKAYVHPQMIAMTTPYLTDSWKSYLSGEGLTMTTNSTTDFTIAKDVANLVPKIQWWNAGVETSYITDSKILNQECVISDNVTGIKLTRLGLSVGSYNNLGNRATNTSYIDIGASNGVLYSTTAGNQTLNFNSFKTVNQLRDLANAANPAAATQRMVLYDTTAKQYAYTALPTSGGATPVVRKYTVGFTNSQSSLTQVTSTLAATSYPTPAVTPTFSISAGDEVYLDASATGSLYYGEWHTFKISGTGSGVIVDMSIVSCDSTSYTTVNADGTKVELGKKYNLPSIIWTRIPADIVVSGTTVVPANSIAFKLGNSKADLTTGSLFRGVIRMKYVANSTGDITAVTTV